MNKSQNDAPFFGAAALSGLAGLVAFASLMVVGGFDFSPAAFLAILVAVAVFVVMLWAYSGGTTDDPNSLAPRNVEGAALGAAPLAGGSGGHDAVTGAADAAAGAEARAVKEKAEADSKAMAVAAAAAHSLSEDYDGDGEEERANEGTKPEMLSEAREGGPDNLKEIKGVVPAMENLLHSLGVFHFDQIAAWDENELAWIDANLKGFKGRASRDNWVDQAKILAAGGETEFSKRVEDGGVY